MAELNVEQLKQRFLENPEEKELAIKQLQQDFMM